MSDQDTNQPHGGRFWGFMRPVIDTLARPWKKDHCRMAYESEILRLQYTAEFSAVRDISLTMKDH